MSSISLIYSDLMSQNYSDAKKANVFKLAILFYIQENNFSFNKKTIEDLYEFTYRFVIDINYLQNVSSNVILQNIVKYSPSDLLLFVKEELENWMSTGKGYLDFSSGYLSTTFSDEISESEKKQLKKVIDAICFKTLGNCLEYDSRINVSELSRIKSIEDLKKTRLWNRAIEKTKFCICCDEANINDLYAVLINKTTDKVIEGILTDPNNTLILCKKHAYLFESGMFKFDEFGKIKIIKNHYDLDTRMRISRIVLNKDRIEYLKLANIQDKK